MAGKKPRPILVEIDVVHECWGIDTTEKLPGTRIRCIAPVTADAKTLTNVWEVSALDLKRTIELMRKHPQVKRWVRNVVGMFGLPTATGTFYPDFFAELLGGRDLLVEYKGEHLIEHEQQKKNIGERWEEKSGGKALFLWAIKKDGQGRDVHRQLQDKLAGS